MACIRVRHATGVVPEAPLRRGDLRWLIMVVLAGGVVGPLLLMVGLAATPASAASLLLNLEGVFTVGIAWPSSARMSTCASAPALRRFLSPRWSCPGPETASGRWGSVAIVAACVAWGIDNNLTRNLSTADPVQLAVIKGLAAGTINVTIGLVLGSTWPSIGTIAATSMVGLVGYGISLVCFILALRHLGTARTGAYFSLAPFAGALIAILAFREPVTPTFLIAAGLMALGFYCTSRSGTSTRTFTKQWRTSIATFMTSTINTGTARPTRLENFAYTLARARAAHSFFPSSLSRRPSPPPLKAVGRRCRGPLATVVIGGLFTSTVLTLVVLPVWIEWLEQRWPGWVAAFDHCVRRTKVHDLRPLRRTVLMGTRMTSQPATTGTSFTVTSGCCA